jgi:hypothetical protein
VSTSDLRPRRLPTQTYLLGLVAAVGIPLLAFAAFLLLRYAATERARFERDGLQFARQVALVVDSELAGLVALLKGLAASSALARDDFAQFHAEASSLIGGRDEVIVLRDLGSRQFVNTQRPFGSDLPPAVAITPADRAAFAAGQPVVSGVYLSPISAQRRDRLCARRHRADRARARRAAAGRAARLDHRHRRPGRHLCDPLGPP